MVDANLDFQVRFLLDKKGQADVKKAIADFEKSAGRSMTSGQGAPVQTFQILAREAKAFASAFGVGIEEAAQSLSRSPIVAMEGIFRASKEEILASVRAADQLGNETKQVAQSVANIDRNMQSATKSASRYGSSMLMGMTGFTLAMTGMQLQKFGQGILSPVKSYIEYAGMANDVSREWTDTMKELQQANLRIGQSLASTVLPILETAADVAEQIAAAVEKNPPLAKAAASLAIGSIGMGGLLMVGGQILSGIAALKSLGMLAGAGKAATVGGGAAAATGTAGAVGATVFPMTAALAIGTAIAAAVTAGINKLLDGSKLQSFMASSQQKIAATERGAYPGVVRGQVDGLTNSVKDLGNASQTTSGQLSISGAALDAFIKYRQQERDAEETYSRERSEIVEQYGKERAQLEEEFEKQRADLLKDYNRQAADDWADFQRDQAEKARDIARTEARSEEDYYRQRAKLAAQYNLDVQRMEEDHQRRMMELRREHLDRVADLTDQRDALGLWREMRDYERQRQDEESQYQTEARRRAEDFALRMVEQEQEFAQSRARRLQDYQQQRADEAAAYQQKRADAAARLNEQLKELAEEHKAEMVQLAKQKDDRLKQLDVTFQQERAKRARGFADQLRDLDAALLGERNYKNAYYAAMAIDLQNWVTQWRGVIQSNLPGYNPGTSGMNYSGRASGGYMENNRLYRGGERGREWVNDNSMTLLMERMAGGRLTNAKVAALLMGGGGKQNISVNMNLQYHGEVGAADKASIRRIATEAAYAGVVAALEG